MRIIDFDILIIPGWLGSGTNHWQSRWARSIESAKIVNEPDWIVPDENDWVENIEKSVSAASRPVVLVAHSVGVIAVAHAAFSLPRGKVAGAFLVSPADVENASIWPHPEGHIWPADGYGFTPIPLEKLPFSGVVISSSNDPYCTQDRARHFATSWQCEFINVGAHGHITTTSGFGPWPAGFDLLQKFLSQLN